MNFWSKIEEIQKFLLKTFSLKKGLDKKGTIIAVKSNIETQGVNAWLLITSILVASIGLDLNSPAIIIGAMLISPLMFPILGVGLSVGINDKKMLSKSLQHFSISVGIALITSFLYFWITPMGEPTHEIISRTAPTLLDVLVALFGGIAGIVSSTRKDKSNAIPGVAIATALMPPVCVTGYGIAAGEWSIMIKSFYLFFLNATFVALATYLIVRYLKFPFIQFVDEKERIRNTTIIAFASLILIIPSIYILSGVLHKLQEKKNIEYFINNNFENAITRISNDVNSDTVYVKVYLFNEIEHDSVSVFIDEFNDLGYSAKLDVIHSNLSDSKFIKKDFQKLEHSLKDDVLKMLETEKMLQSENNTKLDRLTFQLDSLQSDTLLFKNVSREIKVLFADIEKIGFAKIQTTDFDTTLNKMPVLLVNWKKGKSKYKKKADEKKIMEWIKIRAKLDTLQIVSGF